jgi:sRNA-binding protein
MNMSDTPENTPKQEPNLQAVQAKIVLLAFVQKYPSLFDLRRPTPLAIGIHKELNQVFTQFSMRRIRIAVSRWVKKKNYHYAVMNGTQRYNLKSEATGKITDEQKADAKKEFDTLHAASKKFRKDNPAPRRPRVNPLAPKPTVMIKTKRKIIMPK